MITTYTKNKILNEWFRGTAIALPTNLYIALSTTAPSETGTNVTEPTAASYARKAVVPNTSNFSAAANGSISNAIAIRFTEALTAWSLASAKITHYGIYDAATGGNLLFYGALTTSQEIPAASIVEIPIGAISFSITNIS